MSHLYRQKVAVLLVDLLAFLAAFAAAMHLRFQVDLGLFEYGVAPWDPMIQALPIMTAIWLGVLHSLGLYRLERLGVFEEGAGYIKALFILTGILLTAAFFFRGFSFSRGFTLMFMPLVVLLSIVGRVAFRGVRRKLFGIRGVRRRVILVGNSAVARHMIEDSDAPHSLVEIIGLLDDSEDAPAEVEGVPCLGRLADLAEVGKAQNAQGIIIAAKLDESVQLELLDVCLAEGLEWQVVPNTFELMLDRVRFEVVAGVPVLGLQRSNIRGLNRVLKRGSDIVCASLMLLAAAPLMLVVAVLIKLTSRGPVFFSQDRVGEGGRLFKFHKFRTMRPDNNDAIHREYAKKWIEEGQAATDNGDEKVYKLERDPRVTAVGQFIRRYSIDELPQLLNVLKGDMSLIGPRPPIPYEVEVYREWHRRRFEGPQGITGLWQVSGRNRLSFDEMVKLDIEYIENWSFALDLKILWRTIGVVLFDRAY